MVARQIESRGVADDRVLDAMSLLPRHFFVPPHRADMAYDDCPLPIGRGQTISQPYMVALMTELLDVAPSVRVLEVGTGSGYQTAILAMLAAHVYSVELLGALLESAETRLAELGLANVSLACDDGSEGWFEHAPYDRIVVAAAPPQVPSLLPKQLTDGGHLVIPVGVPSFQEALHAGASIYRVLGELLQAQGHNVRPASGPFAPSLKSNKEAIEVVMTAIEAAGYRLGEECFVGMDAATSELHRDGWYVLAREGRTVTSEEMADLWAEWLDDYPIVSIEDGMSEEDWDGWQLLAGRLGGRVQLVGDDLFTTDPARVRRGIELGAANAVLIKPNQIGSLTETLETMRTAREAGWAAMLSSRSGESEDTTIADLAVLEEAGQIKMGPPCTQGIVKYNRLLRIAEELGDDAEYAGREAFRTWRY